MQLKPHTNAKDLARKFSLHTKWRISDSHFEPMRGPSLLVNDTPMTHEQQPDLTIEGSTRRNLAQLYGEDDPGISRGKPFLWCPSSAFQALLKYLTAGILFPFWALSGLG
ncbi:hypothetical protein CXB51_016617 [Gossypium anomalum]|uniref:Uncharacterized protein n=1 Tax=Gossypium anomalum TaxID=47600 RepID=A0A8J6CYY9_9ROSI|nr:hypothetical protein CXB51_016617 [Gossypium anomalum]